MNLSSSILCPIDFSEASAGALRYGAAIATRFGARLIVLSVEDPLLTEAFDLGTGTIWSPDDSLREMKLFAGRTFGKDASVLNVLEFEVAVGKPAPEVLRVARERSCSLIVISTHGLTGARKLFFGSTTERVLRETTIPVLITPLRGPGPVRVDDAKRLIGHIVVPVDLSEASVRQTAIAGQIAEALAVPLILVHVLEPVRSPLATRLHGASVESNRRAVAEVRLNELLETMPARLHVEPLVAYGDPAEEVAKVAHDRRAGLVIMGLHGSPLLGPRMGSVTYRLLCLSPTLVLALPPKPSEAEKQGDTVASLHANA